VNNIQEIRQKILDGDNDLFIRGIMGWDMLRVHEEIIQHHNKHRWTLTIAPRGIGKSQIGNTGHHILRIIKDKNQRVLVISKTRTTSQALIRLTREQFEQNDELAAVAGLALDREKRFDNNARWSATELTIDGRTEIMSEATVTSLGIGSTIVGRHYDSIYSDDLVDHNNCQGREAEELQTYVEKELLGMLNPYNEDTGRGDELHFIGTRYSDTDLYQHLIETGLFEVLIIPCYVNKNTGEYVRTIEDLIACKEEGILESVYPQRFTVESLEKRRKLMGNGHFFSQFMGTTKYYTSNVVGKFSFDNIHSYLKIPEEYEGYPLFGAVDPATGEGGDSFVCGVGVVPDNGPIWLVDVLMDNKMLKKEQSKYVAQMNDKYKPVKWLIEANAYQKTLLQDLSDLGMDNIEPHFTRFSKKLRFDVLRGVIDLRGLRYKSNMVEGIKQLEDYEPMNLGRRGYHDDFIDFLDMMNTCCSYDIDASSGDVDFITI